MSDASSANPPNAAGGQPEGGQAQPQGPALRRWFGATIWDWISHRPDIIIRRHDRVVEGTYHEVRPENEPPESPVNRHLGPPRGPAGRTDNLDHR